MADTTGGFGDAGAPLGRALEPGLNEILTDICVSSAGSETCGRDGGLGEIVAGLPEASGVPDVLTAPACCPPSTKNIFGEGGRSAWNAAHIEARCDFTFRPRITRRADLWFLSVWQKSVVGRTLTDIKGDDSMIPFFAREVGALITEVLGAHLREGGYALVTSPKRRHKVHNFATLICSMMAERLEIPFYEDAAFCHSRHRLNAVFEPGNIPEEKNVIVFDDFVTSGSTLRSMADLLLPYGKNLVFFTGINNKL